MTPPHEIEITIDADGNVTGEVHGISGPQCGPISKWLDSLGDVVEDRNTPDYNRTASQQTGIQHRR